MKIERVFLTPPEVARRYGMSPETVRTKIESGEIEAFNVGNGKLRPRYRVSLEALEAFERRRSVTPPTEAVRKPRRQTVKSYV